MLVVCRADLLIWTWDSWIERQYLFPQQGVRTGERHLHQIIEAEDASCMLPSSVRQCFRMSWDFLVDQNKGYSEG